MGYQEEKQRQFDLRYLQMARVWAENSYCVRRKVGALLVKDKMIISDGYSGAAATPCDGSTLYVTASPCIECSKLIIQAGIKRVVYCDSYRLEEGLDLLRRVGIECVQLSLDD